MIRASTSSLSGTAAARVVALDALTAEEFDAWHAIRSLNPALDSPYFHPGFAAAVHACVRPVSVVVLRDASGAISALLPGHRSGACLVPVGWPGADFQGPLVAAGTALSPVDLLIDGVRTVQFDHLLSPGSQFDPWIISRQASPFLDTTGGLDGYLGRASRSGRKKMAEARRGAAKAARTEGHVRFAADVVDDAALSELIALKRAQYAATGARDYFAEPDRVALLKRLLHTRESGFGGILSTVHVGERLVAAHFGIRSDRVLHYWFPGYDPAYAHLAPGWILLRELVAATPELGIHRIDLGRGDAEYKRWAKTGETIVAQGVVTRSIARWILHRARHSMIQAAKASPLAPRLRHLAHQLGGASRSAAARPDEEETTP